jgi:high-affinity nickel-transport protein
VAVGTIVSRDSGIARAARIGALWGIGHSLTILAVGGAIVVFRIALPPRLGAAMELAVAAMLVFLGVMNLSSIFRSPGRFHAHGDYVHHHGHDHSHGDESTPLARLDQRLGGSSGYQSIRPVMVGVVHGLAGSAAVALLVVPALRSQLMATVYLAVFGAGTVTAMIITTCAMAAPLLMARRWPARRRQAIATLAGLASITFGCFLGYQIIA